MIPHNTALTTAEAGELSDMLEAKYLVRADELTPTLTEATCVLLSARLARYLYERRNRPTEDQELRDPCPLCDGQLLEDRVRIDYAKGWGVVQPCFLCRPKAFCEYHARQARYEESVEPVPPTERTGELP